MELTIPLRVYTIDGRLIAEFGDQRRNPVPIEEAPDLLVKAILAAEDDRFLPTPRGRFRRGNPGLDCEP